MANSLPDIKSIPLYRDEPVPVVLVSGFLGAGKTTFIKDYLEQGAAQDTAVIVNEFGEIGLDHLILETVADDIVLMENGCLCCASSGDLEQTLVSLYERRESAAMPSYSRVIIETSGIASPESILSQLNADSLKLSPYRYQGMINIVDAQTFLSAYQESQEAQMQTVYADLLLINKTKGVSPAQIDEIQALLIEATGKQGQILQMAEGDNADDSNKNAEKDIGSVQYIEGIQRTSVYQQSANQPAQARHPGGVFSLSGKIEHPIPLRDLSGLLDNFLSQVSDDLLRLKVVAPDPEGKGQIFLQTVRNRWFPKQYISSPDMGVPEATSLVVIAKQSGQTRVRSAFEALLDSNLKTMPHLCQADKGEDAR